MTNRIRDAGNKSKVGRPKTEDRIRHGPSTRGDPSIRGKPPEYKTYGKPGSWLHRESRVLAAKKTDDKVGVFTLNGEYFAETLSKNSAVLCDYSVSSVVKKRRTNHGETQRNTKKR